MILLCIHPVSGQCVPVVYHYFFPLFLASRSVAFRHSTQNVLPNNFPFHGKYHVLFSIRTRAASKPWINHSWCWAQRGASFLRQCICLSSKTLYGGRVICVISVQSHGAFILTVHSSSVVLGSSFSVSWWQRHLFSNSVSEYLVFFLPILLLYYY